MPDKRQHRGPHPDDHRLFHESSIPLLRIAVDELSWLLTRGYSIDASLKLVGDRFELTARQRMAVRRSACSDDARDQRRSKEKTPAEIAGQPLTIDGFNLLITVESAISGGAVFVGRDGCYRDLASVHGTFRKVAETAPAIDLIFDALASIQPSRVDWFLDEPVSNSGRLRTLIEFKRMTRIFALPSMGVFLCRAPDLAVLAHQGIAATSDSAILDRCKQWTNLAAYIINEQLPETWKIDMRLPRPE